ncbi:eCIS core domain-containing protein [Methanosarcina sp. Mfa9]|uniref:eCIS core domain-containing protein n=1 Tax=Methanosarcina sp. Mfa9 TaxID=3439063 RepID=UPI003F86C605
MPLSKSERAYFEPRFGYDFSQVRLQTDSMAVKAARAVNSRAFTVGQDMVFGEGKYAPEIEHGIRLLAHELIHIVQQRSAYPISPYNSIIQREIGNNTLCRLYKVAQQMFRTFRGK